MTYQNLAAIRAAHVDWVPEHPRLALISRSSSPPTREGLRGGANYGVCKATPFGLFQSSRGRGVAGWGPWVGGRSVRPRSRARARTGFSKRPPPEPKDTGANVGCRGVRVPTENPTTRCARVGGRETGAGCSGSTPLRAACVGGVRINRRYSEGLGHL